MGPRQTEDAPPDPVALKPGAVIGAGCEAEIVVAPDPSRVVKRFFDPVASRGRADREARALRLLSRAPLGLCARARFPRLEAHRPEAGEIEMELAQGETLAEALLHRDIPKRAPRAIANGLVHYSDIVGEAYHDFAPVNVMWDEGREEAWFIDLASEHVVPDPEDEALRISLSLGYYLGAVAYEAARPAPSARIRGARRQIQLIRSVVAELRTLGIPVLGSHVRRTAWAQFRDASGEGSMGRRLWYGTVGRLLAQVWIRAAIRKIGSD